LIAGRYDRQDVYFYIEGEEKGASDEAQAVNLHRRAYVGSILKVSIRQYPSCQRLSLGESWRGDRDRHDTRQTAWWTIPVGDVTVRR
jgi:hypothetical protein